MIDTSRAERDALPVRYDVYTAMRVALEEAGAPDSEEIASKAGVALHVKPVTRPDRETIAFEMYESEWPLGNWDDEHQSTRLRYLRLADAVLALFGQGGR